MTIPGGGAGGLNGAVHIASVALATGPYAAGQEEAEAFFDHNYADQLSPRSRAALRKLFRHPSVRTRHFAIEDSASLLDEDPDRRVARFTRWAVELSAQAITRALDGAGLTVRDVGALVVNTCTGYICPGVSTYLIERLGLPRNVRVYDLVGSGCGGAIPNVELSASALNGSDDRVVVSVSVEICSATLQMGDDISLIVSNAIFADGAAAAVLSRRPGGLTVVDSARRYVPEQREHIRYIHKGGQLHNQLSIELPELAAEAGAQAVAELLSRHGLAQADIAHWAVHPGGAKVIDAVRDRMGLSEDLLGPTRETLAGYGNMSSPTVWFVLRSILDRGVTPGDWLVMLAFGAGLSAHAMLLRA